MQVILKSGARAGARHRKTLMSHLAGFTLIELMITVVVLGILAAIAYPSYNQYSIRTRRSDAQTALLQIANQQERFFTECNYYAKTLNGTRGCGSGAGAASSILGYGSSSPVTSPDGHYVITLAQGSINAGNCSSWTCGFVAVADPDATGASGRQAGNGKLRIDSTGVRGWDKAGNGTYGYKWTDK